VLVDTGRGAAGASVTAGVGVDMVVGRSGSGTPGLAGGVG